MIMTYAAKVTEELIPNLIEDAAIFGLNVDYLTDSLEDATSNGVDLYAILSFNVTTRQATFTEMEEDGFNSYWHYTGGYYGPRPHWKTVSH